MLFVVNLPVLSHREITLRSTTGQQFVFGFRCGMLIAIRSQNLGKVTGLMVTASHNPAEDNGVKLVEPSGHMLSQTWEVPLPPTPHPQPSLQVFCPQLPMHEKPRLE